MNFRHEWKHQISYADMLEIRQRMRAVGKTDVNSIDGKYEIRSLYFDTMSDKVLREKLDGIGRREKFRIRYYNGDTSFIHLEKKSKTGDLGGKEMAVLSREEALAITEGKLDFMSDSKEPLIQELYVKMKNQGLKPKTIVDYTREAFTYAPGNVRVTLDYNIRTGLFGTQFLDKDCITIPAGDAPVILEVKWDAFLPQIIQDAVQLKNRRSEAYSKYAACRIYG